MQLIKIKTADTLMVKAEGKIDTTSAMKFGTLIHESLDDIKTLIIDFEKIEYISSLGLRAILDLQKTMNQQGSMKLLNVNDSVMSVFEMTGFNKILTIE